MNDYITICSIRNKVDLQLNQGVSILYSEGSNSLYLIVHEQIRAHIPTFNYHPNRHFEGYL